MKNRFSRLAFAIIYLTFLCGFLFSCAGDDGAPESVPEPSFGGKYEVTLKYRAVLSGEERENFRLEMIYDSGDYHLNKFSLDPLSGEYELIGSYLFVDNRYFGFQDDGYLFCTEDATIGIIDSAKEIVTDTLYSHTLYLDELEYRKKETLENGFECFVYEYKEAEGGYGRKFWVEKGGACLRQDIRSDKADADYYYEVTEFSVGTGSLDEYKSDITEN